jgi:hypothetical protein
MNEAYIENLVGRGVTTHPEVLVSFEVSLLRTQRVLTCTEGNTIVYDLARMLRSAGVHRPWHEERDTSKNLGCPMGS